MLTSNNKLSATSSQTIWSELNSYGHKRTEHSIWPGRSSQSWLPSSMHQLWRSSEHATCKYDRTIPESYILPFEDVSSTAFQWDRGLWHTQEKLQKVLYQQLPLKKELWERSESFQTSWSNLPTELLWDRREKMKASHWERGSSWTSLRTFSALRQKNWTLSIHELMKRGGTTNSPKQDSKEVLALLWWVKSRTPNMCQTTGILRDYSPANGLKPKYLSWMSPLWPKCSWQQPQK